MGWGGAGRAALLGRGRQGCTVHEQSDIDKNRAHKMEF